MNDTLLAAGFALGTASMSSAFSLIARRGQRHGTATTGVVIGLIVNIPWLVALTILTWEPAYWNSEAWFWVLLVGYHGAFARTRVHCSGPYIAWASHARFPSWRPIRFFQLVSPISFLVSGRGLTCGQEFFWSF